MADADTLPLLGFLADRRGAEGLLADAGAGRDPLALVAVALAGDSTDLLPRAAALATTTAERQAVAIAAAYLRGDHDLVGALVPDHLADHPDDVLIRWIAAHPHGPAPQPIRHPLSPKEFR